MTRSLPIGVQIGLDRLSDGSILVANSSRKLKGGFFYFTHPDGQPFDTVAAKYLIRHGLVVPSDDSLLNTTPQTYRVKSCANSSTP